MTIHNKTLLKTIFTMETVNDEKRYSSGPLYSEREIKKATKLLTDKGYSYNKQETLEDTIPVIMFVDPEPCQNGQLKTAYIVLSDDKPTLFGGKDKSWSGGMIVFGLTEPGTNFEDFTFHDSKMVWDFIKKENKNKIIDLLKPVSDIFSFRKNS
jgi:hypothetical protein